MTRVALLDWFKLRLPISTPASDGVFVFVDLLSFSLSDHIMDCPTDLILLESITEDVCVRLLPPSFSLFVEFSKDAATTSLHLRVCAPSSALTKTTGNWEREATHYSP